MTGKVPAWFGVANAHEIPSPALLLYPERVVENIRRMIALAGDLGRLRPHMKTHKMAEVLRLQTAQGITKFKCATIAEAELTAGAGASEVLLAYQPVGPNARRFIQLVQTFPRTKFSTVADDGTAIETLAEIASAADVVVDVLLDVDCGQHRCGVEPGPKAAALYRLIAQLSSLRAAGLHVYDGHIHDTDLAARTKACAAAFEPVFALREELISMGCAVPKIVAGGTPTFPIHARREDIECSPGTCVLWDHGYASRLPDLDFLPAALLLTRVISKPGTNRLCLDLGHKAVASEMPHPRVLLIDLPDAAFITHSEEHLVVESAHAERFSVGDALYGLPWHICPTVALHGEAVVVQNGRAEGCWQVAARERRLTL